MLLVRTSLGSWSPSTSIDHFMSTPILTREAKLFGMDEGLKVR